MSEDNGQPTIQFAIPAPYRRATDGKAVVEVGAETVSGAIAALRALYPEMAARLLTDEGALNPFVSVYLNGARLQGKEALSHVLREGDRLVIMPVIGGGN